MSVASALVLRPSQSCGPSSDPVPVESRIKQDKSDFEEQERQRVAQEAREEKRQKKKVVKFRSSLFFNFTFICIITDSTQIPQFRHLSLLFIACGKTHILILVFQERELVLKRIAEDRKSQQEKMQTAAVSDKSPPSGQEQKLGGTSQANVDNCLLMVKPQTIKTHTVDSFNLRCVFTADSFAVRRVHAGALPC